MLWTKLIYWKSKRCEMQPSTHRPFFQTTPPTCACFAVRPKCEALPTFTVEAAYVIDTHVVASTLALTTLVNIYNTVVSTSLMLTFRISDHLLPSDSWTTCKALMSGAHHCMRCCPLPGWTPQSIHSGTCHLHSHTCADSLHCCCHTHSHLYTVENSLSSIQLFMQKYLCFIGSVICKSPIYLNSIF